MKKQLLLLSFLAFLFLSSFSQDNKFSSGDFGIRYGLTFNGNVGQQLIFSGMLSKRVELGAIIGVSYSSSSQQQTDSVSVFTTQGNKMGIRSMTDKEGMVTTILNPFVAYHFPVKSNLDVYLGINAGVGVGILVNDETINKTTAENYERVITDKDESPMLLSYNGGLMLGCQYFFYKRIAIGAVAALNANYAGGSGKVISTQTVVNTGTDNGGNDSSSESFYKINNKSFSLGTSSYVGINLTFFFGKDKTEEAK